MSDQSLSSYFAWCEYKFLPILNTLGREATILELGCGPGYMLQYLKNSNFTNVSGIDICKEQIDIAIDKGCDAKVADVFQFLEGKNEIFDGIIALDFIEHFEKSELIRLIPLIFKSLRKGGRLVLQTPNGEGLFSRQNIYGDLTHLTIFTPNSLRQLLTAFDFRGFCFLETGPVPKNIIGATRLLFWRFVRCCANIIRRIETGKSQTVWTENMICYCDKPIS